MSAARSGASIPGIQPTVEIAVRRCVIPTSGSRAHAASTLSRFIIGSPMPMKTPWSTRLDAAEVQRLVEDLRRGQVAAELHRAGRAERAGQRAAGLRGQAERAAAVAVAHQHGLDRAAVVRSRNSALTVPSRACASCSSVERRERDLARPARSRSAAGRFGHLVVAAAPARRPLPHLAGAEGGLAARRRACVSRRSRSIARHSASAAPMRLAKYLAHAGVASRRAAEAARSSPGA